MARLLVGLPGLALCALPADARVMAFAPLRLVIFSDLHIDLVGGWASQRTLLTRLAAGLDALAPDVVIFAGDLSNSLEPVRRSLQPLARGRLANLFVPGNHDAWLSPREMADGEDSDGHLRRLRGRVEAAGWHWLPGAPLLLDGWAFAGTMGWFDSAFADPSLGIGMTAYRDGRWGSAVWNDMSQARFRMSDEAVAGRDQAALAADLATLGLGPGGGPPTVAVSHHLPYRDLLIHRPWDRGWEFCNAFMGSPALGRLYDRHPSIRLAVAGHTHLPREIERPDGRQLLVSPIGYIGLGEGGADPVTRLAAVLLHPDGQVERIGSPHPMVAR